MPHFSILFCIYNVFIFINYSLKYFKVKGKEFIFGPIFGRLIFVTSQSKTYNLNLNK